jgi:CRP-like cAMP-binding protein
VLWQVSRLGRPRRGSHAAALMRHLAGEVHRTRTRAEILSLKSVAARLDAWMAFNGGKLPPKGRWYQAASEIGVTPEAFYRELARRRHVAAHLAEDSRRS